MQVSTPYNYLFFRHRHQENIKCFIKNYVDINMFHEIIITYTNSLCNKIIFFIHGNESREPPRPRHGTTEDLPASDQQIHSQGILCDGLIFKKNIFLISWSRIKCCKLTAKFDKIVLKYSFGNVLNHKSINLKSMFIQKTIKCITLFSIYITLAYRCYTCTF